MSIKEYLHFMLDPDDTSESQWKMSIARDGDTIKFGLHWNDKPHPTHSFTASIVDLAKVMRTLGVNS